MLVNLLRYNHIYRRTLQPIITTSSPRLNQFTRIMSTSAPVLLSATAPVAGTEPNLQQDPVTGEMVSKRSVDSSSQSRVGRDSFFLILHTLISQ